MIHYVGFNNIIKEFLTPWTLFFTFKYFFIQSTIYGMIVIITKLKDLRKRNKIPHSFLFSISISFIIKLLIIFLWFVLEKKKKRCRSVANWHGKSKISMIKFLLSPPFLLFFYYIPLCFLESHYSPKFFSLNF